MKKVLFSLILLSSLCCLASHLALSQKRLKEEVKVTAVEIPVRVYLKDQPVKNLTKEDFEIYENGVKQDITGFEIISRKISSAQEKGKAKPKKRLFILIFNVFDYNKFVEEGIDYFFKNIFHNQDQILILTENRILSIERGKNVSEIASSLKKSLKRHKLISTQKTLQTFKNLNYEAERLVNVLQGITTGITSPSQGMLRYLDNYQRLWLEYKEKYITPDISQYQKIIKRTERMEKEKWAICFQQKEIFPQLKYGGQLESGIYNWINSQEDPQGQVWARIIQTKQIELQRSLDISEGFPADRLQNIFMDANITFHMILLKSMRYIPSKDFELMEVSQDFEDYFKKICFSTGGSFSFSDDASDTLRNISEKEDSYYLLVYLPKESSSVKKRNIKVKVKKERVEIVYQKNFSEKKTPSITIINFKASRKTIEFSLINFKRQPIEEKLMGKAEVKIDLFDENSNNVFSEGKAMDLNKKEVHFSITFNGLKSGNYFIIINAIDKISNETDVFSGEIEV